MLLMWDAMGYNCGIRYDKQTGQLIGLSEDFHFGLCVQRFSNKVNVLKVISPQKGIDISFPVCHHHVHTLNRYIIVYYNPNRDLNLNLNLKPYNTVPRSTTK